MVGNDWFNHFIFKIKYLNKVARQVALFGQRNLRCSFMGITSKEQDASLQKLVLTFKKFLTNDCNMPTEHTATLGATGCVRLVTLLQ